MPIQCPTTKTVKRSPSNLACLPENTQSFTWAPNYKRKHFFCELADFCHFVSTFFAHIFPPVKSVLERLEDLGTGM